MAALREGAVTPEALVEQALGAHAAHRELNAMAALDAEAARGAAAALGRELSQNRLRGPLHGIPLTVKDLFVVEGFATQAGTRASLPALGGEGGAVRRLRQAGAILLGKTNMHEIALGLTGENGFSGDVKNPHDPARQAGGSSSGSAVAVAVGIGLASLGTDTGGSIRAPAALCGVVGFKPSHGLVPLDGALALSPTCDHAGPFGATVADVRMVTEVLAATALPCPRGPAVAPRIGVARRYLEGRLAAPTRHAFEALLARLAGEGAQVADVAVEDLQLASAAYSPLVRAEAAFVHREALRAQPQAFAAPVRTALEAGAKLPAGDYLAARAARARVRVGVQRVFAEHRLDALLLPATPAPAVVRGTTTVELESGAADLRDAQLALTAPFSLVGVPAVSLPFAWADGLPLGLQVIAAAGDDVGALNVAAWIESRVAFETLSRSP